jgi:nitroreductase
MISPVRCQYYTWQDFSHRAIQNQHSTLENPHQTKVTCILIAHAYNEIESASHYRRGLRNITMDFFETIDARHSIRAYQDRPMDEALLQQILENINRAPSAGNLQAYEVYVICDAAPRSALVAAAYDQEFLAQAPLVLVFCTHAKRSAVRYMQRGTELYCIQDATIACTFAMLAATALGLSTVWVGAFDEERVRGVLGAPPEHRPVAMLPVGYAAESPRIRPRRKLNDLVHQL